MTTDGKTANADDTASPLPAPKPQSTRVVFRIGYMDQNEQQAMEETPDLGCWYCGSTHCCLTHKYDKLSLAKYPDRSPYN